MSWACVELGAREVTRVPGDVGDEQAGRLGTREQGLLRERAERAERAGPAASHAIP